MMVEWIVEYLLLEVDTLTRYFFAVAIDEWWDVWEVVFRSDLCSDDCS
jgi:hypothetical protein